MMNALHQFKPYIARERGDLLRTQNSAIRNFAHYDEAMQTVSAL
jgi:hypothetical protein